MTDFVHMGRVTYVSVTHRVLPQKENLVLFLSLMGIGLVCPSYKPGYKRTSEIRVGVQQGSCLSPLLFIIGMDAILEHVRREVPWDMLYADDLIVADKDDWMRQGYRHVSLIGSGHWRAGALRLTSRRQKLWSAIKQMRC